jgi:hypothetical protein
MFPSGKGATDSCTVGGSDVVNIDVVDAEMNESGDMVEGKEETNYRGRAHHIINQLR